MSACAHQPRTLVAYFSITGPTYTPDGIVSLEKGNTQTFAETICEFTGADLFRIERENPYPDDYEAICSISRQETESGARPALKADIETDSYDVIYIGWPCWGGTMPMCVRTFLESHDLSGKKIIPFSTHEGSGFGHGLEDLKASCPGATIIEGLALAGHEVKDAQDQIRAFCRNEKYRQVL